MQKFLKKPNKLLKNLFMTLLLVVPLYPKFPFIRIPGTYVSIRLEDFLIFVIAAILFIYLFPRMKEVVRKNIEKSIVIFLLAGLVSTISGIWLIKTVSLHIGLLHWIRRVEYFVPFFLGAYVLTKKDRDTVGFFVKGIAITIFIAFLYGLGQKYLDFPVIITQNQEYAKGIALSHISGAHLNSTFAGHYDLASYLVLTLPVLVSVFVSIKERKYKVYLGVAIFSGLWLMANALSRISIASYMISSVFALFIIKKYKAIPVILFISIVIFGFSSNLLDRYLRFFEVSRQNIQKIMQVDVKTVYAQELPKRISSSTPKPESTPVFEDRSVSIRLNVEWPRAIRAFKKNPLLGTGYSSITLATDNDFLRLLGEVGLIGFSAFFLVLGNIFLVIKKSFPLTKRFKGIELAFVGGILGSIPGVLLNATFIDIFEASKFAIIFWLLIGLFISLLRLENNEKIT